MFVTAAFDPARWMPRRDENLMEYWISFSPMAPMMGVKWRFAEMMEIAAPTADAGRRSPIRGDAEDAEVVAETPAAAVARTAARQTAEAADAAVQTVKAAADMARKAAEAAPAPQAAAAPKAGPAANGASSPSATPSAPAAEKPASAGPKAAAQPPKSAAEPANAAPGAAAAEPQKTAPEADATGATAKPSPAGQPKSAAPQPKDDLTMIKGIGPKAAESLAARGITRFAQIAAWSERDVDEVEASLGGVPGRIRRDDWIGQAKKLAG